jgi:hypothetical protein
MLVEHVGSEPLPSGSSVSSGRAEVRGPKSEPFRERKPSPIVLLRKEDARRLTRPPRSDHLAGHRLIEVVAVALVAIMLGFLFQVLVAAASSALSATPKNEFDSALLQQNHGVCDALLILTRNILVFACFLLSASLFIGWRIAGLIRIGRVSATAITAALIAICFWRLAQQNASLGAWVRAPRMVFVLALPHGPLEFGGFFAPLIGVHGVRSQDFGDRIACIRRGALVGLALLIIATAVENWVSPVLLSEFPAG